MNTTGWSRGLEVTADGSEVISDFRVRADQKELFGPVTSVHATWRTLNEIAGGGTRALGRITAVVNAARQTARAGIEARHSATRPASRALVIPGT